MKRQNLFAILIVFTMALLKGCRKEDINLKKITFFGDCKVTSLDFLNNKYSVYFGDDELPKGLNALGQTSSVSFLFEFESAQLTKVNLLSGTQEFAGYQMNYKDERLTRVRLFDKNPYDLVHYAVTDSVESNRCDFLYSDSEKPISMNFSTYSDKNGYQSNRFFTYEYDSNGNLVKEDVYRVDAPDLLVHELILEHAYDDKPNTVKQLNYLFFDYSKSAPYLFSKNNKISTTTIDLSAGITKLNYIVKYDSRNNVVSDGDRLSEIAWDCN